MQSFARDPGLGTPAAGRPELYRELRRRNERRARVARLLEGERESRLQIAPVMQMRRTQRARQGS